MNTGCCFEIVERLSTHYCFSYIDSEDNLASFLFNLLKVDVETEREFHREGDAFKIVMCRIPRQQRESFLRAIDLLPGLMDYAGREGYGEFCLHLVRTADRYLARKKGAGSPAPLQ